MIPGEATPSDSPFRGGMDARDNVKAYLEQMQSDAPSIKWKIHYTNFDIMKAKDRDRLADIWTKAANSNPDNDSSGVYVFEEDKIKGSGLLRQSSCIIVLKWGEWKKVEKDSGNAKT